MDAAAPTNVTLVRWPSESDRLERLAAEGVPRLLLIEDDAPPPVSTDILEDWIRVPAPVADLVARVEALGWIASSAGSEARTPVYPPTVEESGLCKLGEDWILLRPLEGRLASLLADRIGTVVSREHLTRAAWPDGEPPGRNALDVHMARLRRKLAALNLSITTVRSRGYLLSVAPDPSSIAHRPRFGRDFFQGVEVFPPKTR